jgi:hypothetical protein
MRRTSCWVATGTCCWQWQSAGREVGERVEEGKEMVEEGRGEVGEEGGEEGGEMVREEGGWVKGEGGWRSRWAAVTRACTCRYGPGQCAAQFDRFKPLSCHDDAQAHRKPPGPGQSDTLIRT